MNHEIKQRIDQLNNGEIPDGYKKTEFGIFPCDWETKQLNQLLDFKNGVNADKEKYNSGTKMISVNDILTDRPIVYESIQGQVDVGEDALKEYSVTYGDILFQRSSETFEDAGKSNVYLDPNRIATYSGFVIRGKKKAEYEPYYLNEALRMGKVRKQIIRHAAGSQHINVGQDSLASVIIPFATSQEQSRIAEILMKWDDAIELQEQIIEKLYAKRGAIIQRIIKKKDGWHQVQLSAVLRERNEYATKDDGYPHASLTKFGVSLKTDRYNRDFLVKSDDKKYKVTHLNDICYNPANLKFGVICINKCEFDAIFSPIYVTYEVYPDYNVDFIGAILCSADYIRYIRKYEEGTVYERQAVKSADFVKGAIWVPDTKDEQDDIANIISKVNEQIQKEVELCDSLKLQRKVMQQYLLNGIVRVNA